MSKTVEGLIQHCKDRLDTPYAYGVRGEILTQAILDRLARRSPSTYTSTYEAKAVKCIGQRYTDCNDFVNWYIGYIRGSYNYYDTAVERASIDHLNESMTGWALWKPGHIGVYIGDGYCIEAKGINYGTIKSRVTAAPQQRTFKLYGIDYTSVSVIYTQGFQPTADGQRWWYQSADGNYAANGWCWLQEMERGTWGWYLFDSEGYMLTGHQVDPTGEAFLLCPITGSNEGECMITGARGTLQIADEYDMIKRRYMFEW